MSADRSRTLAPDYIYCTSWCDISRQFPQNGSFPFRRNILPDDRKASSLCSSGKKSSKSFCLPYHANTARGVGSCPTGEYTVKTLAPYPCVLLKIFFLLRSTNSHVVASSFVQSAFHMCLSCIIQRTSERRTLLSETAPICKKRRHLFAFHRTDCPPVHRYQASGRNISQKFASHKLHEVANSPAKQAEQIHSTRQRAFCFGRNAFRNADSIKHSRVAGAGNSIV